VGQTVVLSRFQIKNGDTPLLDDNFLTDASLIPCLAGGAGDANGLQLIGDDGRILVSWSTPDSGYCLQSTSTPTIQIPGSLPDGLSLKWVSVKRVLVHSSTAVPDPIQDLRAGRPFRAVPNDQTVAVSIIAQFPHHKPSSSF